MIFAYVRRSNSITKKKSLDDEIRWDGLKELVIGLMAANRGQTHGVKNHKTIGSTSLRSERGRKRLKKY